MTKPSSRWPNWQPKNSGYWARWILEAKRRNLKLAPAKNNHDRFASIFDLFRAISPELDPPLHLQPIAALFERAILNRESIKAVIACPPQHGKTTLALHGLIWAMLRKPNLSHAYISYSASIAEEKLYIARMLAEKAGLSGKFTAEKWLLSGGGQIRAAGIGGSLTGHKVDGILIIDDYFKSRLEAESPTMRKKLAMWFSSAAMTRLHPGASCLVVCTRWHPDDLGGTLIKDGWHSVILPAIDEQNRPLWPEKRPIEFLENQRKQIGEHDWLALYQGQPRPREGTLFKGVFTFSEPPAEGRTIIGLDFSYSRKTSADFSAAVVLRFHDGKAYVLEVFRAHLLPSDFAGILSRFREKYPKAEFWAGISSTERGTCELLRARGVPVKELTLSGDKWSRAQRCAAAWSSGSILVPEKETHGLDAFLAEVLSFTGVGDDHDDQVDALVSAFEAGRQRSIAVPPAVAGSRTWV